MNESQVRSYCINYIKILRTSEREETGKDIKVAGGDIIVEKVVVSVSKELGVSVSNMYR